VTLVSCCHAFLLQSSTSTAWDSQFIQCIQFVMQIVGQGEKSPNTHHFHHASPALPHFSMMFIHIFNADLTSTAEILASTCHHTSAAYPLAPLLSLAFPPKVLLYPGLPFVICHASLPPPLSHHTALTYFLILCHLHTMSLSKSVISSKFPSHGLRSL